MVKCPSKSVATPFWVPFSRTAAPIMGSLVLSITVPVIFIFWPQAVAEINRTSAVDANPRNIALLFAFLINLSFIWFCVYLFIAFVFVDSAIFAHAKVIKKVTKCLLIKSLSGENKWLWICKVLIVSVIWLLLFFNLVVFLWNGITVNIVDVCLFMSKKRV